MRKNLLLILSMFVGFGLFAQGYEQDFDGFTAGDYLAEVDTEWTTWTNAPGTAEDPTISDAFSLTAPNSVMVSGTNDAVYPFGDKTSGAYEVSFDMYVPAGKAGYYNLQHVFASEWAVEVYLNGDLTSQISAGGQELTNLTYAADTWFNVSFDIDLNEDLATMYWDDVEIITWQWSLATDGTAGENQLGCANMYAGVLSGMTEDPEYYFDNFMFNEAVELVYESGFDMHTSGDYLAVVDEEWTTWTNAPGTAEDPIISDAQAETAPNSVMVSGTNDAVFPFGDKTSGVYGVSYDFYVPAGMAGYYNLQHVFASEWAVEVFLYADGTSKITAGGQELTNVTYAQDTWFNVFFYIDLNEDVAVMSWDDTEIIEWQWSLATDGTAGENQLGCANMYAGAENGETPMYYFDNFTFVSLSNALTPATVEVDTEEFIVEIADGTAVTETFSIANVGQENLEYVVYPTYDVEASAGTATHNVGYCADDVTQNIGSDGAVSRKIAVLLESSLQEDYIGTTLESIEVFMADQALDMFVKVWAAGETTVPGPGEVIYSASFNATIGEWSEAMITDEIVLDGNPIYIGVEYFQPAAIYAMGCDAGPKVAGVNWSSTGPGWSEFSLDYNWAVRANTVGDPMPNWMDVPVEFGMIPGGGSETVAVFMSPDGLANGQYTGSLVVAANDPVTNYTEIDVTLDIITATSELNTTDAVMVYPNPTNDVVFVKADAQIEQVIVSNYLGQVVDIYTTLGSEGQINVSQLDNGVYFLEVTTDLAKHTIKVIKK